MSSSTFFERALRILLKEQKLHVAIAPPMSIAATSAVDIAGRIRRSDAGAVVMIMAGKMSEVLIRDMQAARVGATIHTLSVGVVDAKAAAGRLGGALRGVVAASVVPPSSADRYGIVEQYRQAVAAAVSKRRPWTTSTFWFFARCGTGSAAGGGC